MLSPAFIGSRPSAGPRTISRGGSCPPSSPCCAAESDLDYSVRSTPGGRHVALTLDISVQTAEQVRSIYAEIREIEGLDAAFLSFRCRDDFGDLARDCQMAVPMVAFPRGPVAGMIWTRS